MLLLFSCDYCYSRGRKINKYYRHNHLSIASKRRTLEETIAIAKKKLPDQDVDGRKGVKCHSPLFDLQDTGFDVIRGTPVDSLHCQDLGITRTMIDRLAMGGKEAKEMRARLDSLLLEIKTIREIRRLRSLDHFKNFKGSEFQTICLVIFPIYFGHTLDYNTPFTDDETFRLENKDFSIKTFQYL